MNPVDRYLRLGAKIFALGGWILSIIFSANGFGFRGGVEYIVAGYFLACLVTMFEVVLNHYGTQLPKTLAWICFLAYAFGSVTNMLGIYQGRGAGGDISDYAIAIILGLILEIYPEPLFMLGIGARSADLLDTLSGLFRTRKRQPPQQQYPTRRTLHPDNPRRRNLSLTKVAVDAGHVNRADRVPSFP